MIFKQWCLRQLRRAIGTDKLMDRIGDLERAVAQRPFEEGLLAAVRSETLKNVLRTVVDYAGEDGVLTCRINDQKLNMPTGAFGHLPALFARLG